MSIRRYTTVMRHAVMLRPPNFQVLPAESSTDTNSSHLLRETRGELSRRRLAGLGRVSAGVIAYVQ
jgi:hypothetical protein